MTYGRKMVENSTKPPFGLIFSGILTSMMNDEDEEQHIFFTHFSWIRRIF